MTPYKRLLAAILSAVSTCANAQEGVLFIGTGSPPTDVETAVLIVDVQEKNKGFLLPRYPASTNDGTNHRGHAVAGEEGMMYYDTNGNNVSVYNDVAGVWNSLGFFPVGSIVMWSGDPNAIPAGWALCDGGSGTPNLSGRFIVGLNPGGAEYGSLGAYEGGGNWVTITEAMMPRHSHGLNDPGHSHTATLSHDHSYSVPEYRSIIPNTAKSMVGPGGTPSSVSAVTTSSSSFSGTYTVNSATVGASATATGGGEEFNNRPSYLVLAFIMRIN